jgi:hypothetical protein
MCRAIPRTTRREHGVGLEPLAESATYLRYSGFGNLGLGARAQLRQKPGVGGDVPGVSLAQAIHRNHQYDYRDGW